ncbi:MAG: NADP-dependent phosphogluconate dehydrogenase [Bacteroidetes bacterium]|nr:NADP-dependent phosphogluconate dehydrogenase [Bacteroidota bacterium]
MSEAKYDYGMIGLGTMGRNLLLNMSDHSYAVAGFDLDAEKVSSLKKEGKGRKIFGAESLQEFVDALKVPRTILLLVPAGDAVDKVILGLKPLLSAEDLIMDCGNSHYTDTDRRVTALAKDNIHFMGVGVSGGEMGARYGPSIMPGGSQDAYERIGAMLEAVSAKVDDEPCVTYLGPGACGHYVKMVHNGIEYAIMQIIAEAYHILKEMGGMSNQELHTTFTTWNEGKLRSFLIEITGEIFARRDDKTNGMLIDMILDSAQQKGTGKWTSQDAMDLVVPIPTIDAALSARYLSADKQQRTEGEKMLKGPQTQAKIDRPELVTALEDAIYFSMIISYAQGMTLLNQASKHYGYDLKLEEVAKIWRGGCIIRSGLLEHIRAAYAQDKDLVSILLDEKLAHEVYTHQKGMRRVLSVAVEAGIPMPAMMSCLAYYDSYRRGWMPSNLIQAQRDFFGAHTYHRTDREGIFHTEWEQKL